MNDEHDSMFCECGGAELNDDLVCPYCGYDAIEAYHERREQKLRARAERDED
jgi:hypothetical protein